MFASPLENNCFIYFIKPRWLVNRFQLFFKQVNFFYFQNAIYFRWTSFATGTRASCRTSTAPTRTVSRRSPANFGPSNPETSWRPRDSWRGFWREGSTSWSATSKRRRRSWRCTRPCTRVKSRWRRTDVKNEIVTFVFVSVLNFFCWTKFLVDFFFPSFFSTSNPSKLFRRINLFLLNPILTNIFWLTTCTINQLLASGDLTGCSRGVLTNAWPSCKSVQRATFKIYSTNAIFKYLLTYLNLMCLL